MTFQILLHNSFEKLKVALLGGDDALPVPLVNVGAVIVIEEVVLADGAHVGADAFAELAVELLQGDPFPLGGGLDDLRIDGMLVAVVGDVELNRSARSVAIEHVIDAALDVDDEWHLHHHEVEFFAEMVLDIALDLENGFLGIFRRRAGNGNQLGRNFRVRCSCRCRGLLDRLFYPAQECS